MEDMELAPVVPETWGLPPQESQDLTAVGSGSSPVDFMLCDSGSRLISGGFTSPPSTEDYIIFINAGGEVPYQEDSPLRFQGDAFYVGGDVLSTNERITDSGDHPFIYESARFGNFSYSVNNLQAGDYFVDLHFVEIIFTHGPKGMRVFNVFIQEDKVLSEFDIFHLVGANKPLQLVDTRVCVKKDGILTVRFEGVNGSPLVSGICIRRAPAGVAGPQEVDDYVKCDACMALIKVPVDQKKLMQRKFTVKYEKDIRELSLLCKRKTDECYEAWMSLSTSTEQLEKVRMDLDNRTFEKRNLEQALEEKHNNLKMVTTKYEHDKQFWATKISYLDKTVKTMKMEQRQLSRQAHECVDSIPELNNMVYGVQALVVQCEDLKMKYFEEQSKRRRLFNQLQEAKGNIRVFCRCRPLNKEEASAGFSVVADFEAAKDGCLGILAGGFTKKAFKFDRVYSPKDDQVDVFADASPLVVSVLDGYNVCIFAYGQTGTGKTFTMEGTDHNRGVNYRTLEQLFATAQERNEIFAYNISVSVLEVYNEQIRDLLATSPSSKKLEIKQASEGFHNVPGIVEAKVENIKEAWDVLQAGSNARAVGSNNVNEHSSRSHCMLCIMVRSRNMITGECTRSKLWLVDLAGSERLAKTDVQGDRLKEAQNINKSLSALGDVISALANKSSHIPYRNSKLTHLLQDSLGGDSKTVMFVQISPTDKDLGETLSSLNFATRVRGVELGPAKKQIDPTEIQKMKATLEKARQESRLKDETLRKLEENAQALESKAKNRDQVYKSLQEKVKELEGHLDNKTSLYNQSERQISQLLEKLKGKEEVCYTLQEKVKELESTVRVHDREASELTSLQQKIRELESRLAEKEEKSESASLHQKIKELEDKLRQHEQQQLQCQGAHDCNGIRATTPRLGKGFAHDVVVTDMESHILRSSNSMRHTPSQGSAINSHASETLLQERRRKRNSRSSETENFMPPSSLNDKRIRKSDPPRVTKTVRPITKPITTVQGATLNTRRVSRDPVQGMKDRDNKKKIWSR
ncbi:hypothetical protein SAY86_000082 [Trapa natans]|uniref:Kinesin motor domain-containing protein n=1 Tax=Trapa natans TaxID=22666 RepID=A0AAN7MA91_TRANT|nr:hypothetical protein SAY86_000082 [Trapa natans]